MDVALRVYVRVNTEEVRRGRDGTKLILSDTRWITARGMSNRACILELRV